MMKLAVLIAAAGASTRYAGGGADPAAQPGLGVRGKLDEDLGGRPVVHRTVELFTTLPEVTQIIVAAPAGPEAERAFRDRHGDKLGLLGCTIVRGGERHRYETVAGMLAAVASEATHAAVHDAARPCTSPEVIARVLDAARRHPAVIPVVPVADTLKKVGDRPLESGEPDPLASILGAAPKGPPMHAVERTVDRAGLVAVQTPQVFEIGLLRRAYAQADLTSTDDSQLVERLGEPVVTVLGDPRNLKITVPADLAIARAVLGVRPPAEKPASLRF